MRRLTATLVCVLCLAAAVNAQTKKSPVTFDSYEWDFGTIEAAEGTVCHTFTFTNRSKETVKIDRDIPSCECIRAFYEDINVEPGQKAEVMIAFSPKKESGKSTRRVELVDRDGNTLASLSVKAIVKHTEGGNDLERNYPYRDHTLSYAERTENLISLLTPEEKVGLMMNKSVSVDRLGIESYNWWSEACHGIRQDGYTVYPQPIGMAAAFNSKMVYDVFSTVSDEARANWNRSERVFNVPMGVIYYPGNPELTFWCPNVNIFRDPRWGRGQETYGEDPYLNAILGVQNVLGMQGNDDKYFKTHACAKHYAVHSGPEPLRHTYDASVSMRDLWETYLPAFKALVQKGNVREVMCAYNRYEGIPCCTSDRLLVDILRRKWDYDGIVLTDCDAINNFYNKGQHETHAGPLEASVDAVLNGTDLECGKVFMVLEEALEKGLITEEVLDGHLRRTLYGRFELGMFDPADMIPWKNLGEDVISSESNHQLAVQAARESMVLLDNDGILPLAKNLKKIAVVGPNADDAGLLNGNYGGTPTKEHTFTLLQGIREAVPGTEVYYSQACPLMEGHETISYLKDFNDGKGVYVEFFNNNELEGTPDVTGYYNDNYVIIKSDASQTSTSLDPTQSIKHIEIITAAKTKPFILLAGISGTGKSRIVRELAFMSCPKYLQDKDGVTPGNYCMIEVKPNWHDSTELLGYYSNISKGYQFKKFVKFLVKAKMHPEVPFFVCLDEMNLAPVEQYFAEILSILETRKHPKTDEGVDMDRIKTEVIVESKYFKSYTYKDEAGALHDKLDMTDKDWYETSCRLLSRRIRERGR